MSGVMYEIFSSEEGLVRGVLDFFSVARTTPLVAAEVLENCGVQGAGEVEEGVPLMPREVTPWLTALSAYSVERD